MKILPCDDSPARAAQNMERLHIPRALAAKLGHETLDYILEGSYPSHSGKEVKWRKLIERAVQNKVSIPPDRALPSGNARGAFETTIVVSNETTLSAAHNLVQRGYRPLALNFANGIHPCGGFLSGARAQEEYLCRSSGLFATLKNDPMYSVHRTRTSPDSTNRAILSPGVPIIRDDDGRLLDEPWLLDIISSAPPYAPKVGLIRSTRLLRARIRRVLDIARAYGYTSLVLGAWGCGAFENDPQETAISFREALLEEFANTFEQVVFAITDRSPERRILGPFCEAFAEIARG